MELSPRWRYSRRRIRTHIEWNVETHIAFARRPTSAATRSRISAAALLVNVMAMNCPGPTPWWRICQAMRWVRTRVLPDPAPATISSGEPVCTTASRWGGFMPSSSGSSAGSGRPVSRRTAAPAPASPPPAAAAARRRDRAEAAERTGGPDRATDPGSDSGSDAGGGWRDRCSSSVHGTGTPRQPHAAEPRGRRLAAPGRDGIVTRVHEQSRRFFYGYRTPVPVDT